MAEQIDKEKLLKIPMELRKLKQWVCYKLEDTGKPKPDKIPYDPVTGKKAKANDPKTWRTFTEALSHLNDYDGIGFVLSKDDPYFCIDLDHCKNGNGLTPEAEKIIKKFNTWTEYSINDGGHIWGKGKKHGKACKKGDFEIYTEGRFIAITANQIPGTPSTVENRQDELNQFYNEIFGEKKTAPLKPQMNAGVISLPDQKLIDKAINARNGTKFKALMDGDVSGHGNDDSAADLALCRMLAFWTNRNHNQIDQIFRQSGLMRDKWDKVHHGGVETYGHHTIEVAIKGTKETYEGKSNSKGNNNTSSSIADQKEDYYDDTPLPEDSVEPFPVDILPNCLKNLIVQGAKANQCAPDLIAIPALVTLGAAIGNSRKIQVKRGWVIKPNLYICVIAKAGTGKSPAQNIAIRPMKDLQKTMADDYYVKMKKYEEDVNLWEVDCAKAKKAQDPKPPKIVEPYMDEIYTSDTTVEALAQTLERNHQGITIALDELTAWVNGLNQYKGGKGADREYYLSFWSGVTTKINRKGKPPTIINDPFLSVSGGMPPSVLGTLTDEKGRGEDGFIHRMLFSYPDPVTQQWTDDEINQEVINRYNQLFLKLRRLTASMEPVTLNADAHNLWVKCYNDFQGEKNGSDFPDNLYGVWSKMDQQLAKMALIIHSIRLVEGETESEQIDLKSMASAAKIIKYFQSHARRVYAQLVESAESAQFRSILAWKKKHDKTEITVREITRARLCANTEEAIILFGVMQKRRIGSIEETGGRGKKGFKFVFNC